MPQSPLERLEAWSDDAREAGDPGRTAMVLTTVDGTGAPSSRVVLLKAVDHGEVVFGTSLKSRKGRELLADPRVALVLFWPTLNRQVRIAGGARAGSRPESEALWASRGADGKLVDLVSDEGAPLPEPERLARDFAAAEAEHGAEPPCPDGWAAVRVRPDIVEFWSAGERRLAVRELYEREAGGWRVTRLQP